MALWSPDGIVQVWSSPNPHPTLTSCSHPTLTSSSPNPHLMLSPTLTSSSPTLTSSSHHHHLILTIVQDGFHGGPPLYHISCMYELQPIAPGEGGFGCIAGSHRPDALIGPDKSSPLGAGLILTQPSPNSHPTVTSSSPNLTSSSSQPHLIARSVQGMCRGGNRLGRRRWTVM